MLINITYSAALLTSKAYWNIMLLVRHIVPQYGEDINKINYIHYA